MNSPTDIRKEAIELQNKIMDCFERTCDYDYDRFVGILKDGLLSFTLKQMEPLAKELQNIWDCVNGSDFGDKEYWKVLKLSRRGLDHADHLRRERE